VEDECDRELDHARDEDESDEHLGRAGGDLSNRGDGSYTRTSTLRISHFPDPPQRRYPATRTRKTTRNKGLHLHPVS
jgi:hypothetical protein